MPILRLSFAQTFPSLHCNLRSSTTFLISPYVRIISTRKISRESKFVKNRWEEWVSWLNRTYLQMYSGAIIPRVCPIMGTQWECPLKLNLSVTARLDQRLIISIDKPRNTRQTQSCTEYVHTVHYWVLFSYFLVNLSHSGDIPGMSPRGDQRMIHSWWIVSRVLVLCYVRSTVYAVSSGYGNEPR